VKSIIYLILFIVSYSAWSADWTYIIFIAGDGSYVGPEKNADNSIDLKDQGELLYKEAVGRAKSDKNNSYVIYYDPRKRSDQQLEIYQQGARVYRDFPDARYERRGLVRERDTTDIKEFSRAAYYMNKYTNKQNKKMFYYYGEHFGVESSSGYDYSHKRSVFNQDIFFKGLSFFGKVDLLFMQTCYVNTIEFLTKVKDYSKTVLSARLAVPNQYLQLESLTSRSLDGVDLSKQLIIHNSNRSRKFDLIFYQMDETFDELLILLKKLIIPADYREVLTKRLSPKKINGVDRYDDLAQAVSGGDEFFFNPVFFMPDTKEVIVDLFDYLSVLSNFSMQDDQIEEIISFIENHPEFARLKKILLTLN
jgi:hypothetical protein